MLNRYLILGLLTVLMYSCKDDDDDVATPNKGNTAITLRFEAMAGTDSLVIGDTFSDYRNQKVIIELLQYYIDRIQLTKSGNNTAYLADVAIIDHTYNKNSVTFNADPGQYTGLKFGLGLDAVLNASDPTTFPEGDPLATSQNTYWGWNKYQFFKIEGRVDSLGDSKIFGIHTGLDANYRQVEIASDFFLNEGTTTTITLQFDINEVFTLTDTVDYLKPTERFWHGETTTAYIAEIISNNVAASFKRAP